MKVRIGIGSLPLASGPGPGPELAELIDELETRDIDSLWLADTASAPTIDPVVGMAFAAGRTRNLKLGTGVLVLPGRNPALVAAQLASLAALAPRRILPAFGVRSATPADRGLYPVPDGARAALFDEALTVVRRLLSEPRVTHHGRFFHLDDASVAPLPSRPLDLWLGGRAPAGLRRIGRLADGWLGSVVTPAEAGDARAEIERAAEEAGREIEQDHYGTNIAVVPPGAADSDVDAALARVTRRRSDIDPALLVPRGWDETREQVRRFVEVGLTKFVIRPAVPIASWRGFLDQFSAELGGLEAELSS
ncbi:TIGR03854 family LLM class F420-dependent oxidoreductase [Pseudonocardia xinjiangensis]|uniref:TIGR03854 family LLM class F420-dependent oxidoreductase n=1 Tax=Pseudonocardia xinjiangensis TaxID=75289 RepID=UPI003D8FCCB9